MTYQRTLKVGDLIIFKGVKGVRLVVRSEWKVSHDDLRGDSYSVSEIDTVKLDDAGRQNRRSRRTTSKVVR